MKVGPKEAAVMHTEGKDSRSGKREGREEKREGADEAGNSRTELYQSFPVGVVSRAEVMLPC